MRKLQKWIAEKAFVIDKDLRWIHSYLVKKPLRVLISGSSGLIGSAFSQFLAFAGHEVYSLVRKKPALEKELPFPNLHLRDVEKRIDFEGFDVLVHLAGENIGKGVWTKKKKKALFASRVETTKALAALLSQLTFPPRVAIFASAVGFYGDCGSTWVTESDGPGSSKVFLTALCRAWEATAMVMASAKTRVVRTRFGMVLSERGGAFPQIARLFRLGLGTIFGKGVQYISWISIDDAVGALYHLVMTQEIEGAVNIVAPHPVSQRAFAHLLANSLQRRAFLRMPAWLVRLVFGQKGKELFLLSTRVHPKRLLETGYDFCDPTVEKVLKRFVQGRP